MTFTLRRNGTKVGSTTHDALSIMDLNEQIKSKIINDFDKQLQTEFSTDLYAFIATVKLDSDGDSFHENVDVIYEKYGPQRLREFLDETIQMLKDFQEENAND